MFILFRAVLSDSASAVPGDPRGLEYIHQNYGALPWKDVVFPAVRVARYGFPLTEDSLFFFNLVTREYDFLTHDPIWAIDFAPNGTRLGLGEIMTRRRYANTLEAIANEGADAFYTGAIANSTVRALQAQNGTMTMKDLENYKVISRKPVETFYRGYRVLGCGAPASGAVTMSVLKTVEGYADFGAPNMLNLSTHRLVEAMRFGYAQRASLGDPDFVEGMDRYQQEMFDEAKSTITRGKISDFHTLNISAYNPSGFEIKEDSGTSQITSADEKGMAISLTTTINLIFGNHIMVAETGVILNDEMEGKDHISHSGHSSRRASKGLYCADFSIPKKRNEFGYSPSPANYIRPRKRPMSSVTPTIVEHSNNSLYYVIGSAGGSHIITATLQALWHVLDHNMTAMQALAEPRVHDQLIPNVASFEWNFNNATVDFMQNRLHNISWARPLTSAQGIRRLWNGSFEAAGEPRQKASAGYTI